MSSLFVRWQKGQCEIECGLMGHHGLHPLVVAWFRGEPVQVLRPLGGEDGQAFTVSYSPPADLNIEFLCFSLLDIPLSALRATWDATEHRFKTTLNEDLLLKALIDIETNMRQLLEVPDRLAVYAYLGFLSRLPSPADFEAFGRHHAPTVQRMNGVRAGIVSSQEFGDKLKTLRPRYSLLSDPGLLRLVDDIVATLHIRQSPRAQMAMHASEVNLLVSDSELGVTVHLDDGARYEDGWMSCAVRLHCVVQIPGAQFRLRGWREGIGRSRHKLQIRSNASEIRVQYIDDNMFEILFQMDVPARYNIELELPNVSVAGDARELGFVLVEHGVQRAVA